MPPHISYYTEYPLPGGFSPFVNGIATDSIQVTRFHKWAGSGGHGLLLEAQSINQQQSDHRETNGEPTIPLLFWYIDHHQSLFSRDYQGMVQEQFSKEISVVTDF